MEDFDFCKFFEQIEEDPTKKITGLTIGLFYKIRVHAQTCESCAERVERILARAPSEEPKNLWSEN